MDNAFASCFIEQTGSSSHSSLSVFFSAGFSQSLYFAGSIAESCFNRSVLARRSASVFTLRMEDLMFGNEFHLLNFLVLHYSTTNASIMQEKITNMPACSCKNYFADA